MQQYRILGPYFRLSRFRRSTVVLVTEDHFAPQLYLLNQRNRCGFCIHGCCQEISHPM